MKSHNNSKNVEAVRNPSCKEMTAKMQGKGDAEGVKACSDCSQDISQISGPERKSKPTPLSQIGFRDPASIGNGQQLTLLSIEVRITYCIVQFSNRLKLYSYGKRMQNL